MFSKDKRLITGVRWCGVGGGAEMHFPFRGCVLAISLERERQKEKEVCPQIIRNNLQVSTWIVQVAIKIRLKDDTALQDAKRKPAVVRLTERRIS